MADPGRKKFVQKCVKALAEKMCYMDGMEDVSGEEMKIDETMEAIQNLPDKYKTVVYLFYYEGYNSEEIATILKKPSSTVRNHLREARGILKERLGEID